jgi:serine protease Do
MVVFFCGECRGVGGAMVCVAKRVQLLALFRVWLLTFQVFGQDLPDVLSDVVVKTPPQSVGDLLLDANGPIDDLCTGVIDNRRIYNTFVNRGRKLISDERILDGEEINDLIKRAPKDRLVVLPHIDAVARGDLHDRLKRGSVMLGNLYDCGRCSNLHANIAGGVVIHEDGLVLTNYHVLEGKGDGKIKGMLAMNHLGQCFAVAEVLAASETADVALVRLASATKFEPVSIAKVAPKQLSEVIVMSHPHNEFYVVTTGLVSRFVKPTMTGDRTTWMEITAEFSGGSSGSGVFNAQGELVGLVSRIHPMFRPEDRAAGNEAGSQGQRPEGGKRPEFVEQILRRCVPLESIQKLVSE